MIRRLFIKFLQNRVVTFLSKIGVINYLEFIFMLILNQESKESKLEIYLTEQSRKTGALKFEKKIVFYLCEILNSEIRVHGRNII